MRTVLAGLALAISLPMLPATPVAKLQLGLVVAPGGLQVMQQEVTIGMWNACVREAACSFNPPAGPGAASENFPVTGIGALDAAEFVTWAQATIDDGLRLPTIGEWYTFSGMVPYRPTEIFTDPRLAWAATYGSSGRIDPTLRGSGGFGANRLGIADVKGNVWEWTSSCVTHASDNRCPAFVAAGEHEAKVPIFVRDPSSGGCATGIPPAHLGLRLVKTGP